MQDNADDSNMYSKTTSLAHLYKISDVILDLSSASKFFYRLKNVRTWENCFISHSEFCVSLKFPPNKFDVSTMQSFYILANSRLLKMP